MGFSLYYTMVVMFGSSLGWTEVIYGINPELAPCTYLLYLAAQSPTLFVHGDHTTSATYLFYLATQSATLSVSRDHRQVLDEVFTRLSLPTPTFPADDTTLGARLPHQCPVHPLGHSVDVGWKLVPPGDRLMISRGDLRRDIVKGRV